MFTRTLTTLFATGAMMLPLTARADEAGQQLLDEIAQAYQQADTYQAQLEFTAQQRQGGWRIEQSGDFTVAYDAEPMQLLIDRPDFRTVVKDQTLYLRGGQFPGRYLEAAIQTPLTIEGLIQAAPMIQQPPLPDVIFLLAEDPAAALQATEVTVADPPEGQQGDALSVTTPMGEMVLVVDPESRLIQHARISADAQAMGGQAGDEMAMLYDYQVQTHNESLPEDLFEFDPQDDQAVTSLQELLMDPQQGQPDQPGQPGQPDQQGQQGQQGQQQPQGAEALENQIAPDLTLSTLDDGEFSLARAEDEVIVLDFWATWCGPCRQAMPQLQNVRDWAQEEGKSVGIYAVNIQEEPDQIRNFLEEMNLDLPVLLDRTGEVAQRYRANAIPQTVIISEGTVQEVHVGLIPNYEQTLKEEITALLEAGDEPQQ
ncbi:MAG: redoxin domain-containing protein [Phycisphaeraceae bacterium]